MARLIVTSPEGKQKERQIFNTVVIGRAKDCDVPLVGDVKASRNHCKIEQRGKEFALSDMGSANGTRLNGEKIGQQIMPLKDGDIVVVGGSKIEFHDGGDAQAAPAPAEAGGGSAGGPGLLDKVKGAIGRVFAKGKDGAEGGGGGVVVVGDKTITCACGAVLSTASKSPGQKVGCPRCKKVYAVQGK
jgi:pSer/pThr/pTyr-binding forkhead associated (FHA) protein